MRKQIQNWNWPNTIPGAGFDFQLPHAVNDLGNVPGLFLLSGTSFERPLLEFLVGKNFAELLLFVGGLLFG